MVGPARDTANVRQQRSLRDVIADAVAACRLAPPIASFSEARSAVTRAFAAARVTVDVTHNVPYYSRIFLNLLAVRFRDAANGYLALAVRGATKANILAQFACRDRKRSFACVSDAAISRFLARVAQIARATTRGGVCCGKCWRDALPLLDWWSVPIRQCISSGCGVRGCADASC